MFPIDPNQPEPRKRHGDPLGSEARSRALAKVRPWARRPEHRPPSFPGNVFAGVPPAVASDQDGNSTPPVRTAASGASKGG